MASTIKVDNVQNQPGTNIVSKCGTDVTLGASGDTVALACGASQTGFGRTGAVNWDTASIKTATFTAVSGNGYFCNTTAGIFNITMPASPSSGDIVGLKDYAATFASYNLTIDRNGSKLDSFAVNKALNTNNTSLTLVYVDGTQGWKSIEEGTGFLGETFLTATGGTPCTGAICGDCKIHTFTGPGTFCVSSIADCTASNVVSYIVVAGGGGGSGEHGAGGGGGGFREYKSPVTPYTASPLDGNPCGTAITVTATGYPIIVGGGGTAGTAGPSTAVAGQGNTSTFSTIDSAGGGGGSVYGGTGGSGGSGGGGKTPAGAGNTPPTTPAQGFNGGTGPGCLPNYAGGGGGGATEVGETAPSGGVAGRGGAGATTSISGSPLSYSGGAGSGTYGGGTAGAASPCGTGGAGGTAGGDNVGAAGTINRGGGSGGRSQGNPGATGTGTTGGSGVVIIRYKFQ